MKALVVFGILLGVIAMLGIQVFSSSQTENTNSVAVNYGIYRNAVFEHVIKTPTAINTIPLAALSLPAGWQALRTWEHRITAGNPRFCYVYGPASMQEINAVRKLFMGSFAVGYKQEGVLYPLHGSQVPLPGFIPDGFLVSVIEVSP